MSESNAAIKTLNGHPLKDTGAREMAETAQTTANAAQTTANAAQSTANAAKAKAEELEEAMEGMEGMEGVVTSVNGKTGAVQLSAEDVGALPDDTVIPAAYALPTASATAKGGVKVGSGLQMSGETLQVKPERYVLIETITTEETIAIARTEEPDGTPYNFTAVTLRIKKAAGAALSDYISMYVQIGPTTAKVQPLFNVSTSSTDEQWCYCAVHQNRGVWERERSDGWSAYNSTITPMYVKIPSFDVPAVSGENITKVGGASVPAGLTIEIWGARA